MAVLISGKLIGPNGDPRPGVTIMLTAVKTSSAVVHLAPSSSTTGPDGSYSLSVEVGTHNVMIEAYGRPFEKVGQITVYSDSKPGTLNDFLTSPGQEELTPAIVAIVDDMRADAATSAQQAKESAQYVQNIADANTYYVTPADPDGTIAGLAGTPDGESFRVAIPDSSGAIAAFNIYKNSNGVAEYITSQPNTKYVDQVKAIASATDGRTNGISSFSVVDNKLVFLAQNGAVFTLDETGLMRVSELYGENVSTKLLSLTGGNIETSAFPLDISARNGRILILDETGKLSGIELDFSQIKLGGIDIQELFGGATPTKVEHLKIGFISGFIHFGFYGQSQVIGTTNGVIHGASTDPDSLMLTGGLRSYGTPGYNTSVPENEYSSSLISMHEHPSGETYCSGMAITSRVYINAKYADRDIKNVYTVNGAGGATVDMLKKGTASYNRMISQHVALINLLASMGEAYHFPAMGWSQGGSDDGLATNPDVWETAVEKLRTDYNADILSATGVKINPAWITNQINNYMRYPALNGKPNIGLRQYKMVTDSSSKYYAASPTYICDFIDVAHWTKESQVKVGSYFEKTRRALLEKGDWKPVHPVLITTSGMMSNAMFHLPEGAPLQFNVEYVNAATNYGFSAAQADGTPIGIDRVRLVSDDTVEIRYTEQPLPGAVLMYGQTGQTGDPNAANGSGLGRVNGMRGNLCDTAGNNEKIYVSASEPDYPLHNWCWMFTESMGI